MVGLVMLVGVVCLLAGLFIGLTMPQWLHGDEWDRLDHARQTPEPTRCRVLRPVYDQERHA